MTQIAILMGSQSDWPVMQTAADTLTQFDVQCDVKVLSAHRAPDAVIQYAKNARENGIKAIICAAGAAAHLAGVVAGNTQLPVLGVPLSGTDLNGMDALLSTVQMPGGIPVATFAIGKAGAKNAALCAVSILALGDNNLADRLAEFRLNQTQKVLAIGDPRES